MSHRLPSAPAHESIPPFPPVYSDAQLEVLIDAARIKFGPLVKKLGWPELFGLVEMANAELERRSAALESRDRQPGIGNR
jgi:hypothetical protein